MKDKTRNIILDSAIHVFSKNPGASLNEVVKNAGVGRATLYRHFQSRDDLIRELTLDSYMKTNAAFEAVSKKELAGKEFLKELLEAIIPLGDRYYFLLSERNFESDPEIQPLIKKTEDDWYWLFEHLKENEVIAKDIPSAWTIAAFEGLIYAAWISIHDGYVASRDASNLVYRTLINGISPEPKK